MEIINSTVIIVAILSVTLLLTILIVTRTNKRGKAIKRYDMRKKDFTLPKELLSYDNVELIKYSNGDYEINYCNDNYDDGGPFME